MAVAVPLSFATLPAEAEFKRLKYESVKPIIGKRLCDENGNWMRLNSNGTMSGHNKTHGKVYGKWSLNHGYVCRNVKMGSVYDEDCQRVARDGNQVKFTRKKGRGQSHVLFMK